MQSHFTLFFLLPGWAKATCNIINMQCRSFKIDRFKSCWNASDARKHILSIITDFYSFLSHQNLWLHFCLQICISVSKILCLWPWTLYSHKPLTLTWLRFHHHIETSPLICANQWNGFYIIMGPSSWKS